MYVHTENKSYHYDSKVLQESYSASLPLIPPLPVLNDLTASLAFSEPPGGYRACIVLAAWYLLPPHHQSEHPTPPRLPVWPTDTTNLHSNPLMPAKCFKVLCALVPVMLGYNLAV